MNLKTHKTPLIPTILLLFVITPTTMTTGCATIAKYLPWEDNSGASDVDSDPVAAAAYQLRRPASAQTSDPSNEALWNHRSAPAADTISYGMQMEDVASIWGRPTHIESAGDSRDGNQRWTYFSGLSSRYGLGSKRTVYFENGHVVGWN